MAYLLQIGAKPVYFQYMQAQFDPTLPGASPYPMGLLHTYSECESPRYTVWV